VRADDLLSEATIARVDDQESRVELRVTEEHLAADRQVSRLTVMLLIERAVAPLLEGANLVSTLHSNHAFILPGTEAGETLVADARIEGANTDRVCYRVRVTRASDASTVAVSDGLIVRELDLCLPGRPRDEVANGSS
jgi:acyl-coenzyme A thioesterase PaaI-like protein